MKERSRARALAVQALYAWEARNAGDEELVPLLRDVASEYHISERNFFYADVLIRLIARRRAEIDETIENSLRNWKFSRLSVIDRNILRLGVTEILFVDDVPGLVTIREMLRLAERYGTPESPRFVNGILDAVLRVVEGEPVENA
ncbi:MAG: transcription antitermination factor NusB [Gemmatimonadota bacterium]|jgi:N utilization substance protein B|nr:transcription antitermination factor NusB [Gemmatimonadota bacterium]